MMMRKTEMMMLVDECHIKHVEDMHVVMCVDVDVDVDHGDVDVFMLPVNSSWSFNQCLIVQT